LPAIIWLDSIPGLSKLNPEIPGLAKRSGIAFPKQRYPTSLGGEGRKGREGRPPEK